MPAPALTATTSLSYAAGTTALAYAGSVFDAIPDLAPYRPRWLQRCAHYQLLRSYYRGTVYSDHPELVRALKLYAGVRQIFGPLRRAVRVDVARVPGGWALPEGADPALAAAVDQVRAWSSHRASYSRAVLHGAVAGELGLLVVDDRAARTATIVPLRPDEVVTGTLGDGAPFGLVVKPGLVDRQGPYEYAALYTPTAVRTFRAGAAHAYEGRRPEEPNLLGFVPLLLSPYMAGEDGVGECAFAGVMEQLDRVNDATSQALDVIQRNAEPLTVFSGVEDVQFDPANNALTLPRPEAKAYTLAPNLVIGEALELIREVKLEFKNLLPQLALDQLASRNDLAYDTVLVLLGELVDHIVDVRTHVDAAIAQAERWAILAAQQMGVFPAGLAVEAHRLDPDRPVIPPPPGQRLALEAQRAGLESMRRSLNAPDEGAVADVAPEEGAPRE